MVLFAENDYMAMVPERSRILHNFALPKWGIQRHMKCIKGKFNSDGIRPSGVTSEHQHQGESPPLEIANSSLVIRLRLGEANQSSHQLQKSPSKLAEKESEEEIKEIVNDKISQPLCSKDAMEEKLEEQEKERSETRENRFKEPISARNENQCKEIVMKVRRVSRKRRRSVTAKTEEEIREIVPDSKDAMEEDVEKEKEKPETKENRFIKPIRARNENQCKEIGMEERTVTRNRGRSVTAKSEKKESVKLFVALSRKEIEEDFMQMLGHRPPRRPRKRPRTVQKQLENLFPADYLTEVTLDMYKVEENPQRS